MADPATDGEIDRLCDFIYRQTGMAFGPTRRDYIARRLDDRLAATGATSFSRYFAALLRDPAHEIEHLVNAVTVNETYFYREEHQLRCLADELLPERLRAKPPHEPIRIWSVPCSSGEEPYSIAIWLLENWPAADAHDIEIVGSDIDTSMIEAAEAGIYGPRALMRLPPEIVARYFRREGPERWRIIEEMRRSVRFAPVNLVDRPGTRAFGRFDVIFCRNVLIYFDDASRRIAAENLYDALAPGGFICLGHSESMSRISPLFGVRRYADAIVYQRPPEGGRG